MFEDPGAHGLDSRVEIDTREDHYVGCDDSYRRNDSCADGHRRCLVGRKRVGHIERSVGGALTSVSIAQAARGQCEHVGQVAHSLTKGLAILVAQSRGYACKLKAACTEEIQLVGVLVLVDHDRVLGLPDQRASGNPRACFADPPKLDDLRGQLFLDAFWNGVHVEQVDVLWEETLALEGRAGYYDTAGALKDVVQNHMLQLLALVAMEPHTGDVHDRKLDFLRSLRAGESRRARYTAGTLATGAEVPAYADEDGVDPERGTETFVEITLEAEAERWRGTRFVLRAGKALSDTRKMVVLRFRRSVPPAPELQLGIDGPEEITLQLAGEEGQSPAALILSGPRPVTALPAYSMVLLDVLEGRNALAVSGEEAEEAWRVVTPVLDAWDESRVPLQEYRAGSIGPSSEA